MGKARDRRCLKGMRSSVLDTLSLRCLDIQLEMLSKRLDM